MISLRIPWKLSTILKTSNKSVWSNLFQYVKVYIFWKFIQYTIHSDETEILKKIPPDIINFTKNASIHAMHPFANSISSILLLICNSCKSWSTWLISLKMCAGFSNFDSILFLLNFIFLFNKKHGLFDFKTS